MMNVWRTAALLFGLVNLILGVVDIFATPVSYPHVAFCNVIVIFAPFVLWLFDLW